MQTTNLETLKIHRLTKEQYEREKAAGRLDPTALYMTEAKAEGPDVYDASNITSGTLSAERLPVIPMEKGGTNAANAADALINLTNNNLSIDSAGALNGNFNDLIVNGIDYSLTSAEYDELLSLIGGN